MLTTIAIITTMRCDLRCAHCLRGYPDERPDFPLELLPRLLDEARPFGARHLALTGGEPHLHPQFERTVETIVQAGYTWHFVSHGGRTEPYEPLMSRYRESLTHVTLSIDGADASTHDSLRRKPGAFERVTAAARHYAAEGFPVHISAALNRKNATASPVIASPGGAKQSLPSQGDCFVGPLGGPPRNDKEDDVLQTSKSQVAALVALAKELGACRISFGGTIPTPWNQPLVLSDAESLELYRKIQALKPNAGIEIRTFSSLYTDGGVHFCGILNLHELTFNPNGELVFCCDTRGCGAAIGSLMEQPLANLIQQWLKRAADLQIHRAGRIAAGEMSEGFDMCAFCNSHFSNTSPLQARS